MIRAAVLAVLTCVALQATAGCGSEVIATGSSGGASSTGLTTTGTQGGASSTSTSGASSTGAGGAQGGASSTGTGGGCGGGATACNGGCVTLATDPENCGTCGNVCSSLNASTCIQGTCVVSCDEPGFAACGNVCVDVATDPDNCGACGMVCPTDESCVTGTCELVCAKGTANCSGDPADGCDVLLGTIQNCAGCGDVCSFPNGEPACNDGNCGGNCFAGFADCDGNPLNGCEVDTATDSADCGACDNVCPSGPNSTPVCVQGECGINCEAGYADCDGNPLNGCETGITSDPNDCGACGNVCPSGQHSTPACQQGSCAIGSCFPGFADCDGLPADGCEVDTNTDPGNCGACGHACAPAQTCTGGACE